MEELTRMPGDVCRQIEFLFTDIDDTLSTDGQIPHAAYTALWHAHTMGLKVIPVTGRPAGWCDMIARMWPVAGVVGENGALAYMMDVVSPNTPPAMQAIYAERPADAAEKLDQIRKQILEEIPGCKVAADQAFRLYDLAIDFCEEVDPLPGEAVERIAAIFREHGATAKISSIHVNGWFGDFDKLSMCRRLVRERFGIELDPEHAVFAGDSPNDEPAFRFFHHGVGVANIRHFTSKMACLPTYVTPSEGGEGFAELVAHIAAHRNAPSKVTVR